MCVADALRVYARVLFGFVGLLVCPVFLWTLSPFAALHLMIARLLVL